MLSNTVENVLSIQKKKSEREHKLKKQMLNTVKERIINYAKFGQTNCFYTIPSFLFGNIPYNLEDMSKYIVKNLKKEGFHVIKINTQYIYISWNINHIAQHNNTSTPSNISIASTEDIKNFDFSQYLK